MVAGFFVGGFLLVATASRGAIIAGRRGVDAPESPLTANRTGDTIMADETITEIEEWRPVEGWPYEVSNLGRIRRLASNPGRWGVKILNTAFKSARYLMCGLVRRLPDGRYEQVTRNVHVLVCTAFHGSRPTPSHQVCHNNGNSKDSRAENLRWGTTTENEADRRQHGYRDDGEHNAAAKLTTEQVIEIRRRHVDNVCASGHTKKGFIIAICKEFQISPITANRIIKRRSWKTL